MAKINFGGTMEEVITSDEFPLKKAQDVLKNEVIAIIGYGVQGPAQAFNMKDNGINVIIGQRPEEKPAGIKLSRMAGCREKLFFRLKRQ